MRPRDQLEILLPALSDLVDQLGPDDLDKPTPCQRFSVQDVLDHMIEGGTTFAHLFRGEPPPPPPVTDAGGQVPYAEFRGAMDDLLDGVRADGALDRVIPAPVGDMGGETFARFVAFDGLLHGFDISRGTGLPYAPPEEVVVAVDGFARSAITDELRDGDTFKSPTSPPEGAGRLERLAAFSGRAV